MKTMMVAFGTVAVVAALVASQPATMQAQGNARAAQASAGAGKQLTCGTKDVDPVTMGLCSQIDLDAEVHKAAARAAKERRDAGIPDPERSGTLLPTAETTGFGGASIIQPKEKAAPKAETEAEEQARVLAKLKGLSSGDKDKGAGEG